MRRRYTLSLLLLALLPALTVEAVAATPAKRIATAQKQVKALAKKSFAKGARARVLRQLAKARKASKRRKACAALRATVLARNALLTPQTWRKRKVPRRVRRRIAKGLGRTEKALLRRAGRRCGKATRSRRVRPRKGGSGFTPLEPIGVRNNEQGEEEEEGEIKGGRYRPIKTPGGPTGLGGLPQAAGAAGASALRRGGSAGKGLLSQASPLNIFLSSDVGVPPRTAEPQEPTTAVGGNVAWFTGNSSAALSLDGGTTWTRYDPSTILPDPGGQPFCCDQLVSYSPQEDIFIWLLQYWCPVGTSSPATNNCNTAGTGSNTIRIAVASPADLRNNRDNIGAAWTFWDFPPSLFGLPANSWFDRSDMSVNSHFWNWTVDSLRAPNSSILGRVPLSQLKNKGTITISWATDTPQRMTTTQGTGTPWTYFVGANSLSQARIWEWAPNSGTMLRHDINHSSVPINNGGINGSDGTNWYARWGIFPGAVESAAWVGNQLIVAQGAGRDQCTANCNTSTPTTTHVFDHPAVYISRFSTNDWTLASERWLWNPTQNFAWPFLAVAGDGSVGITFLAANDNANPQPVAGFLNEEQFVLALGETRPQGAGDYYTLRPGRTPSSFVIPVRTNEQDSDGVVRNHWRYIEYGHGGPPSNNAPAVNIIAPLPGRTFSPGLPITFRASATDIEDGFVPEYAIVWRVDGVEVGRGSRITYSGSSPGVHTATVTATDGTGNARSASVQYTVSNPGGPAVAILSPDDNTTFTAAFDEGDGESIDVQYIATASDPNNKPLTYTWTASIDGGAPFFVSSSLSPVIRLHVVGHNCRLAVYDLTLTVSNGTDTAQAQITSKVKTALCIT
jgi:PKD domain